MKLTKNEKDLTNSLYSNKLILRVFLLWIEPDSNLSSASNLF